MHLSRSRVALPHRRVAAKELTRCGEGFHGAQDPAGHAHLRGGAELPNDRKGCPPGGGRGVHGLCRQGGADRGRAPHPARWGGEQGPFHAAKTEHSCHKGTRSRGHGLRLRQAPLQAGGKRHVQPRHEALRPRERGLRARVVAARGGEAAERQRRHAHMRLGRGGDARQPAGSRPRDDVQGAHQRGGGRGVALLAAQHLRVGRRRQDAHGVGREGGCPHPAGASAHS
mmetsp:Transcript_12300/g.28794  ORF Transcript_12300/g.28794 Transcript_12300/m.28794 type:complete len:227 (+) Transcript_12300:113-793(+)